MNKNEKILISVLVGIAIINFWLQHRAGKKIEELKKAIIDKK
jgi:hypothetical protein